MYVSFLVGKIRKRTVIEHPPVLGTNPGTGELVRNKVPSVCSVGLVTHQTITHISGKCGTSEC